MTRTSGRAGIEAVAAEEVVVLLARAAAEEDVRLRPAGHADALGRDVVVAAQVVLHHAVLDDVDVAVRRDDALADGVVPARDVRRHREPEPARRDEERHRVPRLHVREDERRAALPHGVEQPPRDVPARAEVPALHRALETAPPREEARAVGVEHPVRVSRLHALEVEAVAVVEPDRERVVAELPVERAVERGRRPAPRSEPRDAVSCSPRSTGVSPRRPVHSDASSRGTRKTAATAPSSRSRSPSTMPASKKSRIESWSGRTSQTRFMTGARTPSSAAIRSASDAPSSPWKRSASSGVPHAGQPSTPKTVDRAALELAAERVAEPADGRVVLEHEDVLERLDLGGEPLPSKRLSHGMFTTRSGDALALGELLGGEERLVQEHGPVGEEHGVAPIPQHRAAAGRELVAGRQLDPPRRRPDREPDRDALVRVLDRPADERARLLRVRRLHDRHPRERPQQRDVAHALVRLARPGRDQTRVVERVHNARALARLVVDLLVRARREEGRERVDDRQEPVPREARRRPRPCPARRSRTRRSGPGTRARTPGHGSRRRGRRRARACARSSPRARAAPPRTPRRRTRRSPCGSEPQGVLPLPTPARLPAAPGDDVQPVFRARRSRRRAGRARARRTRPRSSREAPRRRARTARHPARRRARDTCRRSSRARPDAP